MKKEYVVELTKEEREYLHKLISSGSAPAHSPPSRRRHSPPPERSERGVTGSLPLTVREGDGVSTAPQGLPCATVAVIWLLLPDSQRVSRHGCTIRYMIVDSAIYVDGRRAAEPASLQATYEACREQHGLAWIGLYEPTEEEFSSVAEEFELHPLAVEDAIKAHQRPKLERYDGILFVVLRPARYIDESETVEFGEIHVFVGADFVVTVRHGEASTLDRVRRQLESMPEMLRRGPVAILYAIMDQVVDDYAPVVSGLEHDIDEIETEVFGGNMGVSRRIYELSRESIQCRRATAPLVEVLSSLVDDDAYQVDPEVRRYLRDVRDHTLRITDKVVALGELLQNILSVNLTLVNLSQNEKVTQLTEVNIKQTEDVNSLTQASIAQNDQVKKISAWAAILVVPTIVTGVYGMNFEYIPELHWLLGYPFALALIVLVSVGLYFIFKRSGWL